LSLIHVRINVRSDLNVGMAELRLRLLHIPGFLVVIVPQNIAEFWKFCTRPSEQNVLIG
jgi:hypothetical protein